MSRHILKALCALTLATAVAPAAQAQLMDSGFYFEVAVGKATFKDVTLAGLNGVAENFFGNSFGDPLTYTGISSTLQDKDRSYALISGYRMSPYLSFEAGYFRLGAFQYASSGTVSDGESTAPGTFNFSYRAKGFLVGATATLPVGSYLELRGRAGVASSDTRVKVSYTINGDGESLKGSENSQDFYYGAGVGVNVWDYYRLGLDFMRHSKVGRASGNGTTDVDNILLSFSYVY
jgi:opacity protein-like surface antigen